MKKYIPADVPIGKKEEFLKNFLEITNNTGRLMLFAGDQKIEHLNNDFYGEGISQDDNNPEHLFKIAANAKIGVFATQFGLITRYANLYPDVPYLVKLNSKTNIIPYSAKDPYSKQMIDMKNVIELKNDMGVNIKGVGYTVYLGSEYEREMLSEAAKIVHDAHKNAMIAVLWMYPKGKFVKDEHDPHIIAGAAGVAACLGADFAKVKVPYKNGKFKPELLKEATSAAGNTGVLCEGGKKIDETEFLKELYAQIHIGGSRGNGTGRNIHQRPIDEAIKMANAIYAITCENKSVEDAIKILRRRK
ncbi:MULTISPECIES: aldolase [unclassified Lebetimonas]|uniref:aldolase n=1 Tax=unclassified Lebetimonas TaxID=2648158 RepID=UPI00046460EF|nr:MULTISPECIES: aldolase [unclassified Lebetimonas]